MRTRTFGPYRLVHQIAVGGMAEIYLAKTKGLAGFEKYVALKMIHPNFSEDEQFIEMLIDEAKLTVQLQHVNIAQTFDLGRVGETYYITMEYVDGADLYQLMRRGAERGIDVPVPVAAHIAREIATALDYAHNKVDRNGDPLGIVHRDVSPQNVLISHTGEVKIVDFGIAKASMRAKETQVGVIKGKYYYMSPEQAWGDRVDRRTDIFSTGILLHEMLAGRMLYYEEDLHKLLEKVRKAEIRSPQTLRPSIPDELDDITMKALGKRPADRYQSASDMAHALERFLNSCGAFSADLVAEWAHKVLDTAPSNHEEFPDPPTQQLTASDLAVAADDLRDENSVIFRPEALRAAAEAAAAAAASEKRGADEQTRPASAFTPPPTSPAAGRQRAPSRGVDENTRLIQHVSPAEESGESSLSDTLPVNTDDQTVISAVPFTDEAGDDDDLLDAPTSVLVKGDPRIAAALAGPAAGDGAAGAAPGPTPKPGEKPLRPTAISERGKLARVPSIAVKPNARGGQTPTPTPAPRHPRTVPRTQLSPNRGQQGAGRTPAPEAPTRRGTAPMDLERFAKAGREAPKDAPRPTVPIDLRKLAHAPAEDRNEDAPRKTVPVDLQNLAEARHEARDSDAPRPTVPVDLQALARETGGAPGNGAGVDLGELAAANDAQEAIELAPTDVEFDEQSTLATEARAADLLAEAGFGDGEATQVSESPLASAPGAPAAWPPPGMAHEMRPGQLSEATPTPVAMVPYPPAAAYPQTTEHTLQKMQPPTATPPLGMPGAAPPHGAQEPRSAPAGHGQPSSYTPPPAAAQPVGTGPALPTAGAWGHQSTGPSMPTPVPYGMGPPMEVDLRKGSSKIWWILLALIVVGGVVAGVVATNGSEQAATATAKLEIISSPEGAEISIDGKVVDGVAPLTLEEIERGVEHVVEARLPGHEPESRKVTVPAEGADRLRVLFPLEKIKVRVVVTSDPAGASVHLNGLPAGNTPFDKGDLELSQVSVIEVRKPGFVPQRKELDWSGDRREQRIEFTLERSKK